MAPVELGAAQKQIRALSSRVSDLERQLGGPRSGDCHAPFQCRDSAELASQLSAANSEKDELSAALAALHSNYSLQMAGLRGVLDELAVYQSRVAVSERLLAIREKELEDL